MLQIRDLAQKALDIDSTLPGVYAMLAIVAEVYDYNWKELNGTLTSMVNLHQG
jgi:hypothetical protein